VKIDKPANSNYCATVVELKAIIPLENCENVVATPIFGFQAIVSKDAKVGDRGIVFTAETQLSDEFCFYNNLYRHADKNKDEGQKGYIEDNRRVKAIKFRGNVSNCLFLSLESLSYINVDLSLLDVGDEFDTLSGKDICKKYVVEYSGRKREFVATEKKFVRVEDKHLPQHMDSSNYFKWSDTIDPSSTVIVSQKLHGTSVRIGHTIAKRKMKLVERIAQKLGASILPHTYDYVYGSRKVIKDVNNPYQNHFYETDIWSEQGKKLQGLLPENYLVYGELIGHTSDGKEIQKNYTYAIPQRQTELYIYRIAIVNHQGNVTDLSWDQVMEFCKKNGLKHVPELWRGKKKDLKIEDYIDKRFFEMGYRNTLYLGVNEDIVDEGVCIRVDELSPVIMKAKSPRFFEHETKLLDKGEVDLESSQSSENV